MIPRAILLSIAGACVLSYLLTLLARRIAPAVGMVDKPGGHKAHAAATPLLGGAAIVLSILLPSLVVVALASLWTHRGAPGWIPADIAIHLPGIAHRAPQALGILAAAAALHVMGLIDDKRALGPWCKLLVQVLASVGVVLFCGVRVMTFAGPTVSIVATTLWIVAITNSVNFLDNMDGLAAGVTAIIAAALLSAALSMQQWFVAGWACLLLGATLGFLPHNVHPARIFMGDSGSLVLGFLLAVLSSLTTYLPADQPVLAYGVLAPVLLLAVPIYDTFSVMRIRIREGRNPMVGDRRHFSHRLVRRGMGVRTAVLTIYLCTASTAISASLLPHVQSNFAAMLIIAQVVFVVLLIALLEGPEPHPPGEDT